MRSRFRFLLIATLCLVAWRPATAQISFGKPVCDASLAVDTRSTGIQASASYLGHVGASIYKLRETPLQGPDTGFRVDLGIGLGNDLNRLEAFRFAAGYTFVSDPSASRDHRVNGLGVFAQFDLVLTQHILVGAYGLSPLAKGHDFGTMGLRVGVRLPPYR
jgi:hypothetical protein